MSFHHVPYARLLFFCTSFRPGFPPTVLQSGPFLLLSLILSTLLLNLSPELFTSITVFSL